MDHYTLKWPVDFEAYAWEIESKGWFIGLEIVVGGKAIMPTFYDPVRLSQDVEEEVAAGEIFVAQHLIVVSSLSRESIEHAIACLAATGALGRLAPA